MKASDIIILIRESKDYNNIWSNQFLSKTGVTKMLAIHTKYIKATNFNCDKIKAYINFCDWSVTIHFPHNMDLDIIDCHFEAVKALKQKYNAHWDLDTVCYGDSSDAKGFTFCFKNSNL